MRPLSNRSMHRLLSACARKGVRGSDAQLGFVSCGVALGSSPGASLNDRPLGRWPVDRSSGLSRRLYCLSGAEWLSMPPRVRILPPMHGAPAIRIMLSGFSRSRVWAGIRPAVRHECRARLSVACDPCPGDHRLKRMSCVSVHSESAGACRRVQGAIMITCDICSSD